MPQVAMSSAATLLHHGTLRARVDIPLADVQALNKNMCEISVIFYPANFRFDFVFFRLRYF